MNKYPKVSNMSLSCEVMKAWPTLGVVFQKETHRLKEQLPSYSMRSRLQDKRI